MDSFCDRMFNEKYSKSAHYKNFRFLSHKYHGEIRQENRRAICSRSASFEIRFIRLVYARDYIKFITRIRMNISLKKHSSTDVSDKEDTCKKMSFSREELV